MPALHPLLGSLSLATDLAVGIANEGALRTSLAATLLAQLAGLRGVRVAECGYVGLLRYMGCSGYAHEEAWVGAGDDRAMLAALEIVDVGKPATLISAAFTRLARNEGFVARTRAIARLLSDPRGYPEMTRAHCEQAASLAATLGLRSEIVRAMNELYERWDGRGEPSRTRGDSISLPARVTHVANVAEVHMRVGGPAAAVAAIRATQRRTARSVARRGLPRARFRYSRRTQRTFGLGRLGRGGSGDSLGCSRRSGCHDRVGVRPLCRPQVSDAPWSLRGSRRPVSPHGHAREADG